MRHDAPPAITHGAQAAHARPGMEPAERRSRSALPNVAGVPVSHGHLARTWVLILLFLVQAWTGNTQPTHYSEYQVKGAFLVKFAMFVDWPTKSFPDARTPITIGILGEDPFGGEFEAALKSENANGRHFELKRFRNLQELTDCHMIFVSGPESQRLAEILTATRDKPVLIVGDRDRFAHEGGMVNFIKERGKVRFEVNAAAIEAHGLKISAKLLQVAKPVTSDGPKGGR